MHFISGSFDNSVLVTGVPHVMYSYTTSPSDSGTFHYQTIVTYPNLSVINTVSRWLEDLNILIVI